MGIFKSVGMRGAARFVVFFLFLLQSIATTQADSCREIFSGSHSFGARPPGAEEIRAFARDLYANEPDIQKLQAYGTSASMSALPEVTGVRLDASSGERASYLVSAELAVRTRSQPERPRYGELPESIRILLITVREKDTRAYDVTRAGFPEQALWAHYQVTTGAVALASDPNRIQVSRLRGGKLRLFWVATSKEWSDIFLPINTPELALALRLTLIEPEAPNHFAIRRDGGVDLGDVSDETYDGDLGFGLREGAGVWAPWTIRYLGVVEGVSARRMDRVKPADGALLPATADALGCAGT
jgi:hypothetical protein